MRLSRQSYREGRLPDFECEPELEFGLFHLHGDLVEVLDLPRDQVFGHLVDALGLGVDLEEMVFDLAGELGRARSIGCIGLVEDRIRGVLDLGSGPGL